MSMSSTPVYWHIPYQRNPFFTGREDVLSQLHNALQADASVALSHPLGISGLGGIGKTQTALEYAYRYRGDYRAVCWVRADSVISLTSSLFELARVLELPEHDEQDQEMIVQAVLGWFRLHSDWLLIYDNIDDLSIAEPFLPKAGSGHLLFTTRAHALGGLAQRLDIEKMDSEIGALLLLRKAGLLALQETLTMASPDNQHAAQAISQELDGLPLALDQAGAYIKETACTLSDYLEHYQTRRSDLLRERGSFDQDYPASVATTWSLSFDKVRQTDPVAAALLNFCAYLSPDAIPEKMVTDGVSYLPPTLKKIAHPLQLDRALSSLLAYSLLHREASNQTISIHRLVQAVLQENMPVKKHRPRGLIQRFFHKQTSRVWESQEDWKWCAVRVVYEAAPNVSDVQQWSDSELWLPHALICMAWLEENPALIPEVPFLLIVPGSYLFTRGRYREAEPLCKRALALCEQQVGAEDVLTAACLNNLGELYLTQGKYTDVEPLFERALAICEQRLETESPLAVNLLHNLASLYMEQGDYEKAEPLLKRTLDLREQQLGTESSQAIDSLNTLGSLYMMQGKYAEAESLLKRAMQTGERQLQVKLFSTGGSMNNLVGLYRDQRKYAEAESLLERALEMNEQIVGPEHPITAHSLNYQAMSYHDQGKYEQAESLYLRVLAIREQQLGTEHPDTAISLNNLAELYREQGKYAQAEPLYVRALSIQEKLGNDHPHTALILSNLALLYENQGKYAEAEPLCVRALAIREQKLGAEHPDTVDILNQLAELYQKQEKYAEALCVRALAIRERQLGADHPEVATSLNSLAEVYRKQGKYAEAEILYLRALAIREHLLEAEHAGTASSLNNLDSQQKEMLLEKGTVLLGLALLYKIQGKHAEAEPLLVQDLAIEEKIFGADDPHTAGGLISLADTYRHQRKYAEAEPLYLRAMAIREQELGVNHPTISIVLYNLAGLYKAQKRYAEAESFYQRVLVIDTNTYGAEHLEVATDLNSLAALYSEEGKYAEAEPLYVRALAIREQQLGDNHPDTANSLDNLAELYREQGKHAEAEPLYIRALAILGHQLEAEHLDTASNLDNRTLLHENILLHQLILLHELTLLYKSQRKYEEAEPLLAQILAINEKIYGTDHPKTVASLNNLVDLYRHQRKYAQAEPLYLRAIAIDEKVYGVDSTAVATDLNNLATLYDTQGKYTQAELLYQRALEIYELQLGAEHPYTQTARGNYVAFLGTKERLGKFTDRARNVLSLAQEEARGLQHNYIEPEHMLLGLVRESEGTAVGVLSDSGVELNKVRDIVEFIIGRRDSIAQDETGLTPQAKKVVELAEEEALRLSHQYIEAEHLLLGLLDEAEGIAAGILEGLGVNLENMRAQTIVMLCKPE